MKQLHSSTNESTTTQDNLLTCIRELQKSGTAYTPSPLIQRIPHLIRYSQGDPAHAHELLIALINDTSEPISKIFQGQMSSTVQCSQCNRTTTTTDNTQDISLHIATDSNTSLEEKIQNHIPFDTTLEMEPFMTPGLRSAQRMELIGVWCHSESRSQSGGSCLLSAMTF